MRSETLDPIIAEKVRNLPRSYLTRDFSNGSASLLVSQDKDSQRLEAALQEAMTPQRANQRTPEQTKLAQLERRLRKLEATAPKYRAVWEPDKTYRHMDTVTFRGALWCVRSEKPTKARPGRGPDWRLMTKTR